MDLSVLQTTTMELHPLFDIDNCEWVVEIGGQEVCARTLRELQQQYPDAKIRDYAPDGYVAVRDGFLSPVNGYMRYVPQYKYNGRHADIEAAKQKKNRKTEMQELGFIKKDEVVVEAVTVEAPPPPEKLPISFESVMTLRTQGKHATTIARILECSLSFVQMCIEDGLYKNDPRARAKKFVIARDVKAWTAEEDELLRQMAVIHTAREISDHYLKHRTRNSIIGRCQRQGIKLPGTNRSRQLPRPPTVLQAAA